MREDVRNVQYIFDRTEFLQLYEFLIDNIYTGFDDYVFKQIIGIPIGTKFVPLLGDPYLFYHEYQFLNTLKSDKGTKNSIVSC